MPHVCVTPAPRFHPPEMSESFPVSTTAELASVSMSARCGHLTIDGNKTDIVKVAPWGKKQSEQKSLRLLPSHTYSIDERSGWEWSVLTQN